MNRRIFLASLPWLLSLPFLATSLMASGKTFQRGKSLTVRVQNLKKNKGSLLISLQRDSKTFPKKEGLTNGRHHKLAVQGSQAVYTFRNVLEGRLAIAIFQDTNDNGLLDLDLFDAPTEPYGFSRNPKVNDQAPSFEDSAIDLYHDKSLTIEMNPP